MEDGAQLGQHTWSSRSKSIRREAHTSLNPGSPDFIRPEEGRTLSMKLNLIALLAQYAMINTAEIVLMSRQIIMPLAIDIYRRRFKKSCFH